MKTKEVKTIAIDDVTFALPNDMTMKDLQALGAFLLTLQRIDNFWGADYSNRFKYGRETSVKLGSATLFLAEADAKAAAEADKAAAKAKEAQAD